MNYFAVRHFRYIPRGIRGEKIPFFPWVRQQTVLGENNQRELRFSYTLCDRNIEVVRVIERIQPVVFCQLVEKITTNK